VSTRALTGRHAAGPLLLLTMLAGALLLRLGLAGVAKAQDPLAGAMFGLALLIGGAAAGGRPGRPGRASWPAGRPARCCSLQCPSFRTCGTRGRP